jgi:hypothetical protein
VVYFQPCDYAKWIDEFKLSLTSSLELDEEYKTRCDNENMDRTVHMRHWEEDLIWRNCLKMEQRILTLRAGQLAVCEAHLCR